MIIYAEDPSKTQMLTFVLSSFKIGSFFLSKDRLPNTLKSYDIYKFTCVGCQFRYVNKTRRHLSISTRMKEYLRTDKKSPKQKHLLKNPACKNLQIKVDLKSLTMLLLLLG